MIEQKHTLEELLNRVTELCSKAEEIKQQRDELLAALRKIKDVRYEPDKISIFVDRAISKTKGYQ
jgi:hypothetical protein